MVVHQSFLKILNLGVRLIVTDIEEKLRGLKMEQEADFSEPEQVKLAQPVLAVGPSSALPADSSTPSPAVDASSPASDGQDASMGEKEKKKVGAKAAPPSGSKGTQ